MNKHLREMEDILATLSVIGGEASGGLTRLLYDASWKQAQETLRKTFEDTGLEAWYDAVGNLYGRLEGTKPGETILTGSHVDTVRSGGTLDGQYGIAAGFLAIRRLKEKHGAPKRSLEVVSFAEEEGSRFPYTFWGSKNLVGIDDRDQLRSVTDSDGVPFPQAMREAGFDFDAPPPAPRTDIRAFVEIHIEQGGVLEGLGRQIGVVTAIAGQKRYSVRLLGEANHAGTTPMAMRKDAMECAARCMVRLLEEARALGDPLVLTFGRVEPKPNIANVVPGEVAFTVDTRHTDQAVLDRFASQVENVIRDIAGAMDLDVELDCWMNEPSVPMDKALTDRIAGVCREQGMRYHVMHSGAGHDSQIVATVHPTAMLFVPSVRGISHNPEEHTRMEDLVAGVDALEAVLYKLAYEE